VYEAGGSDGDPYLAAEYIPGVTLQQRIADAPLPLPGRSGT
jgi:hypothetical protein